MLPSCSRNKQLVRLKPAMTETWFQLKWNWITGVRLVKLRRSSTVGHLSQGIYATRIEQRLPRVYGLTRHPHGQRHLGTALSFL
jgi:hypothetical protein